MKLESIGRFIDRGYELVVRKSYDGKLHAMVWLGTIGSGHNYLGDSTAPALEGLNEYLKGLESNASSAGEKHG